MRYYSIEAYTNGSSTPARVWTSHPGGSFDPGALNIQLDLLLANGATPTDASSSTVTIDGVSIEDIESASQFTGLQVVVRGGMKAGLPLANPTQAGTLARGIIYQSFANWIGSDLNLNFVLVGSTYTVATPGGFVFVWQQGELLASAIARTLNVVYPGLPVDTTHMLRSYTWTGLVSHFCPNLAMFQKLIASVSNAASGGVSTVKVVQSPGDVAPSFIAYDTPITPTALQVSFFDLIGQPRWVNVNMMQVQTVLRGDLQVGAQFVMPQGLQAIPGIVSTSQASLGGILNAQTSLKYQAAFQSTFEVVGLRHVGNFRDSSGTAWCSIIQAVPASG